MLSQFLTRYKEAIEKAIANSIESFGPPSPLRSAIEYSLKNEGKRFRPAIVYLVADAVGTLDSVADAALAIEFFHTASLIADDLPCMDDDDLRRERPSLHKAFDEATAILATYALIAAGYDRIRLGAEKCGSAEIALLAIESASRNTGILGATGGQYSDLFPVAKNEETLLEIIDKKTGTLFEISFVFGWLYGGGEKKLLSQVIAAARSFGRAFQIRDDFLDLKEDKDKLNFPGLLGFEKGFNKLKQEIDNYYYLLKFLKLESPGLLALGELVSKQLPTQHRDPAFSL